MDSLEWDHPIYRWFYEMGSYIRYIYINFWGTQRCRSCARDFFLRIIIFRKQQWGECLRSEIWVRSWKLLRDFFSWKHLTLYIWFAKWVCMSSNEKLENFLSKAIGSTMHALKSNRSEVVFNLATLEFNSFVQERNRLTIYQFFCTGEESH